MILHLRLPGILVPSLLNKRGDADIIHLSLGYAARPSGGVMTSKPLVYELGRLAAWRTALNRWRGLYG